MKLDPEWEKKINDVLDRYWKEPRKCKFCESENKLKILDNVFELSEFMPIHSTAPSDKVPVVAVICEECGYIILFNAIALKIIDEDGKCL
jgi:hypothetical protein